MRPIFILAVLLFTALTFYSALWFKSEVIEDDITARVTDELGEDANKIAIDVDGRHVTLSGLVASEADETRMLDVADASWGALGPIDGLTQAGGTGYVTAEKTAEGITLAGVVADDAARAALVTAAEGATDGEVTDALTLNGITASWTAPAADTVARLADLDTGRVTANDGGITISGAANDAQTADALTALAADDDGLTALVTGPAPQGSLTAVKTAAGVTLAGAVSSAALRDSLAAAAEQTTDGTVTNRLTLGAAGGDWEADAPAQVARLADLSAGALSMDGDATRFSGTANDADLAAGFAADGFGAGVTAPAAALPGTLVAAKTADGITLSGAVSSDEVRSGIVASAEGATDGTVTDALRLGAAPADWEAEAPAAVARLGGLSAGQMSMDADATRFSGNAVDADAASAFAADGFGEGVTAPAAALPGTLVAAKTADGITLSGAVSSDEVRSGIIASAEGATDGTVTDALRLGAAPAGWEAEAPAAVARLGGLSAGQMSMDADATRFSGNAVDADAASAFAADGFGEGVTAPAAALPGTLVAAKTADGITLSGAVSSDEVRSGIVASAEGATDGTVTDALRLGAAPADWEATAPDMMSALSLMSSGQVAVGGDAPLVTGVARDADAASALSARFGDMDGGAFALSDPSEGAALQGRVAELEGAVAEREARIASLTDATDNSEAMAALTGEIDTLTATRDAQAAQITDLTEQRNRRDTVIVELQGKVEQAEADAQARITTLTSERDAARASAEDAIADAKAKRSALLQRLAVATAAANTARQAGDQASAEGAEERAAMAARVTELEADIAGLEAEIAERDSTIAAMTEAGGDAEALSARLADLEAQRNRRDEVIVRLQAEKAEETGALTARIEELTAQRARRDTTIVELRKGQTELEAKLGDAQAAQSALESKVEGLTTINADLEGQLDGSGDAADKIAALEAEVDTLTQTVAQRDAEVASLQAAAPATPAAPAAGTGAGTAETREAIAARCSERSTELLVDARVNFVTARAEIQRSSEPLLERLAGIALACVGDGVALEIGGHTDARGSDENNQALSERRANAVLAFLASRGVPTGGMTAVGYGETRPIATNDTNEGMAQNRRISFEWQAR